MSGAPASGAAVPLLAVEGLKKHFPILGGLLRRPVAWVQAVDGIDFAVAPGETLGVVGESGCGKSTTARLLMHLVAPDAGTVRFGGRAINAPGGIGLSELRRQMQMVFQDSYASLNPRLTVADTIASAPAGHGMKRADAQRLAHDLLARVGLEPALFLRRYPHELSGGQRQRVNIARALALSPRLLILDEAVSALDKSVEAQVLNLLLDLKDDLGLTYIFISHDLNVVQFISDRVMVMYLGRVVEIGPVEAIYAEPAHPYTRALLDSMPAMDPDRRTTEPPLSGDPPNPINPPSGCRFRTRCTFAEAVCTAREPALDTVAGAKFAGHHAACHMARAGSGHSKAPAPGAGGDSANPVTAGARP
ncbi:MAG: ABC transporter ATP-binding protein [Alphaproteobacteria bacterium]|nr:ABC transporter ATP-binding protein [Alphaproteobacteria bacterium]